MHEGSGTGVVGGAGVDAGAGAGVGAGADAVLMFVSMLAWMLCRCGC